MADDDPTMPPTPEKTLPASAGRTRIRKARSLPLGLTNNLEVFRDRISELLQHPLVKEEPLRAPHHLSVVVRACGHFSGNPISKEVEKRVQRPMLNDLLRIVRLFEMESEPTTLKNLVRALVREPIEETMRRGAKQCLDYFSLNSISNATTMRLANGSGIDPRRAFVLDLNGDRFHGKLDKRTEWRSLKSSPYEPILYSALLHAAIWKTNAVIEFYRLLRVHGHVHPVPGDPTHTPGPDGAS